MSGGWNRLPADREALDRVVDVNQFNVCVVPGSPALVAELAPRDEAGRDIVLTIRELTANDPRDIHIVGSRDAQWRTERTGSFAAWGAPQITVGEGKYLAELVARYVLGEAATRVTDSRGTIAPLDPEVLTVVVVDGSAGLTQRAPLAFIDGALDTHEQMARFLDGRGALPDELAARGVVEPALWHELAALDASNQRLFAQDGAHGVGRFVATWQVDHA